MLWLILKAAIKPMCTIANVLPIISKSDLWPQMMVLGGNKTLKLNKQRAGSASSSEVRSLSNAQCLIDA